MDKIIIVEDFFALPRLLLKLVGMPSINYKPNLLSLSFDFVFLASVLSVIGFIILNFMYIVVTEFDLFVFSYNFSVLGYTMNAIVKFWPILWKRPAINELKEQLQDILPTSSEAQDKMRACLAVTNRMVIYYVIIMALPASLFVTFPMALSAVSFITTGHWNAKHPYYGWFPFDSQQRGFFEFIFIFEYLAALVTAICLFASDMYAVGFVNQVCTQFDMLSEHFDRKQPNRITVRQDVEFIGRSVFRHNQIVKISEDLDQIFTVANCLNYVVSTVIICTIGFLVIIAGASMEIVRYLPVVLSCIYQIYMVGWMGDKIAFSSMAVGDGVYASPWYNSHICYQKCSLLIIQACQRHQTLTLYKFSVATHESFSATVGNSWKLLAVLRTFYGN